MRQLPLLLVVLTACAAPPPQEGEGEGDVVGEGEGDVVGEGEGEGDVVGEGEGEGEAGDVFAAGPFDVEVRVVDGDVPLRLLLPTSAGSYPAVVFQHGFLMDTAWYGALLTRIASHGVVVVAPQMYDADNNPFGKPSIDEEAAAARDVVAGLSALDTGAAALDGRVVAVGHSRGGKVLWKLLDDDPAAVDAVVVVDPVDGTAGGGRVVDDAVGFDLPTLILGTGLGPQDDGGLFSQPCAPDGDNHDEFAADAPAGAVHLVATDAGHNDVLDDSTPGCGVCDVCLEGADVAAVRAAVAGLVVTVVAGGDVEAAAAAAPLELAPR